MAAFPEEPYGVAGFHQMTAPGFDYSSSDSESTLSTDSDDSESEVE